MIWFEQSCVVPNQPANTTVTLRGVYNSPGSNLPIILITLHATHDLDDSRTDIIRVMYQHNPTMLRQEDPEPSDVLHRYQAKLNKIIKRVLNTNFEDLSKL